MEPNTLFELADELKAAKDEKKRWTHRRRN